MDRLKSPRRTARQQRQQLARQVVPAAMDRLAAGLPEFRFRCPYADEGDVDGIVVGRWSSGRDDRWLRYQLTMQVWLELCVQPGGSERVASTRPSDGAGWIVEATATIVDCHSQGRSLREREVESTTYLHRVRLDEDLPTVVRQDLRRLTAQLPLAARSLDAVVPQTPAGELEGRSAGASSEVC